jgi:uncharacterized protein (TIGR02246 family)
MTYKRFSVLTVGFLLLAGCGANNDEGVVLLDADKEAIKLLIEKYDHGINTVNTQEFVSLFAMDAVVMPPGQPALFGSPDIRERINKGLAVSDVEIHTEIQDITVSNKHVMIWLTYEASRTPKDGGETTHETGKGVQIFQTQANGSWRIIREIWNTDGP